MPRYVSLQGGYFLAVEKRKFLSLKGFNEFYKKPGGEDFELSCKYSRKFGKFFLSRSVKIFTYHENNLINYLKKIFYRSIVHYQLTNRLKLNSKEDNYSSINDKIHIFLSSVIPITLILNFIYPYIFYILFDIKKYFDYIKFSKKKLDIKILIYFHLFGLIRSTIMVIGFILGYIKYNYLNNEKINQ